MINKRVYSGRNSSARKLILVYAISRLIVIYHFMAQLTAVKCYLSTYSLYYDVPLLLYFLVQSLSSEKRFRFIHKF